MDVRGTDGQAGVCACTNAILDMGAVVLAKNNHFRNRNREDHLETCVNHNYNTLANFATISYLMQRRKAVDY